MLFAFAPEDLQTWGPPIAAVLGLTIGLVAYFRNSAKKEK
jgi:hypothetical protein